MDIFDLIQDNELDKLKIYISNSPPDVLKIAQTSDSLKPLHVAVRSGNSQILELLLKQVSYDHIFGN